MSQSLDGSSPRNGSWARVAVWSSVVLLGLAALAVSLVVSVPVSVVAARLGLSASVDRVSGTLWNGTASKVGHEVRWQVSGAESLRGMGLVVNWRLTGPGTDLAGSTALPLTLSRKSADLLGGLRLGPVSGVAGWGVIEAAMPGLPIRCDGTATVTGLRFGLVPGARSADGTITALPATCARLDGAVPPVPTPSLAARLTMDADDMVATLADTDSGAELAVARLTEADRIVITLRAAGAALVPGLPSAADSEIDLPLAALLP